MVRAQYALRAAPHANARATHRGEASSKPERLGRGAAAGRIAQPRASLARPSRRGGGTPGARATRAAAQRLSSACGAAVDGCAGRAPRGGARQLLLRRGPPAARRAAQHLTAAPPLPFPSGASCALVGAALRACVRQPREPAAARPPTARADAAAARAPALMARTLADDVAALEPGLQRVLGAVCAAVCDCARDLRSSACHAGVTDGTNAFGVRGARESARATEWDSTCARRSRSRHAAPPRRLR
jgi:hypothetical protein